MTESMEKVAEKPFFVVVNLLVMLYNVLSFATN